MLDTCDRDGERENYLAPKTHLVVVRLAGAVPPGATCNWSFDDGTIPPQAGQRALRAAGAAAPRLRQADHRRRRHHPARQQRRQRLDRDRGARSADRGPRRFGRRRRRQSRPADRARRRGLLLPALPRRRARANISGRAGSATRATRPATTIPAARRPRPPTGTATARAGCRRPATARSTAISFAPRSRSRWRTRTSPSPSCRSPAAARRSRAACSARRAPAIARRPDAAPARCRRRSRSCRTCSTRRASQLAEPQARPRAAHRRRQRHQILRPRRRRHHQRRRRAHAVQPGRPARDGAAGAGHPRPRLSRQISPSSATRSSRWSAATCRASSTCPMAIRRMAGGAPCPGGRDGLDIHPAFTADGDAAAET